MLQALRPEEAFAAITFTPRGGYVFVLRHGQIAEAATDADSAQVAALVGQVRASLEPTAADPPPFATAAAHTLYADTLGELAPQLAGTKSLVIAPAGALLSLPMSLLLTGPAGPNSWRLHPG